MVALPPVKAIPMDLRKIKKLIDLLEESNLSELEIKEGEEIVRLSRSPKNMTPAMAQPLAAPPAVSHAAAAPSPVAASAGPAPAVSPAADLPKSNIGKILRRELRDDKVASPAAPAVTA